VHRQERRAQLDRLRAAVRTAEAGASARTSSWSIAPSLLVSIAWNVASSTGWKGTRAAVVWFSGRR